MTGDIEPNRMVDGLREVIVSLVAREAPDLTARQMSVFLICYLNEGPHTVRGLAAGMNVSKPAITRALDRLESLQLARRVVDPQDRRSVLVTQTKNGNEFLRDLRTLLSRAFAQSPAASGSAREAVPRKSTRA